MGLTEGWNRVTQAKSDAGFGPLPPPVREDRPSDYGLRDHGRHGFFCTCGCPLSPECDISSVSVGAEFMRHLTEFHGFTVAEVEEELARVNA